MHSISVKKFSGIYQLTTTQSLGCTRDEAWAFFSHPKNLDRISPPDMAFLITSPAADTTYAGQIIAYRIGIFPLIKSSWVTEITHLIPGKMFIDEQRMGPYRMWHHEHHFEADAGGGVTMTDIVSYKLPFGLLGNLIAGRIIRKKVVQIFEYRRKVLEEIPLRENPDFQH